MSSKVSRHHTRCESDRYDVQTKSPTLNDVPARTAARCFEIRDCVRRASIPRTSGATMTKQRLVATTPGLSDCRTAYTTGHTPRRHHDATQRVRFLNSASQKWRLCGADCPRFRQSGFADVTIAVLPAPRAHRVAALDDTVTNRAVLLDTYPPAIGRARLPPSGSKALPRAEAIIEAIPPFAEHSRNHHRPPAADGSRPGVSN
jgi:hypothetical protein